MGVVEWNQRFNANEEERYVTCTGSRLPFCNICAFLATSCGARLTSFYVRALAWSEGMRKNAFVRSRSLGDGYRAGSILGSAMTIDRLQSSFPVITHGRNEKHGLEICKSVLVQLGGNDVAWVLVWRKVERQVEGNPSTAGEPYKYFEIGRRTTPLISGDRCAMSSCTSKLLEALFL